MIISKHRDFETGEIRSYSVCSDIRESGGTRPQTIIAVDTLIDAAIILKYLRGDRIPDSDQRRAKELLTTADSATETDSGGDNFIKDRGEHQVGEE